MKLEPELLSRDVLPGRAFISNLISAADLGFIYGKRDLIRSDGVAAVATDHLAVSLICKTLGREAASFHCALIIGLPKKSAIKHIIINRLRSRNDVTFVPASLFCLRLQLKLPPEEMQEAQLQQTERIGHRGSM